jgi:hypothetical protein
MDANEHSSNLDLTPVGIGDIICYVENYNHNYKRYTYGLVIDIRESDTRKVYRKRQIKIRWFDEGRESWHPDPSASPKYSVKQFSIVSRAQQPIE